MNLFSVAQLLGAHLAIQFDSIQFCLVKARLQVHSAHLPKYIIIIVIISLLAR